jgi:LPXTG-site transpeptidase (sortase) family protein
VNALAERLASRAAPLAPEPTPVPRNPQSFAQPLIPGPGVAGATLRLARSSRDAAACSSGGGVALDAHPEIGADVRRAAHQSRSRAGLSSLRAVRRASALLGLLLVVLGVGGLGLLLTGALASGALLGDSQRPLRDGARSPDIPAPAIPLPAISVLATEPSVATPTLVPALIAPVMAEVPSVPASGVRTAAPAAPVVAVPLTASPAPTPVLAPFLPITRVLVPRTGLETDVVPADLVETDAGMTWQVPAFSAGHAEGSAGAGGEGNALLLGHVTSRQSGNVFQRLDRVKLDDEVQVFSDSALFVYRVVEVKSVARDDVSVLEPTDSASVSLITCTGLWNPVIWDYMERLVVRAELVD